MAVTSPAPSSRRYAEEWRGSGTAPTPVTSTLRSCSRWPTWRLLRCSSWGWSSSSATSWPLPASNALPPVPPRTDNPAMPPFPLGLPAPPPPVLSPRRRSRQIKVGKVLVGGDAPISVQSMTTTLTADINATLQQIAELTAAGCDIVRVACPSQDDADALPAIAAKRSEEHTSE